MWALSRQQLGPIRKQGMEELGVLTLEKRDSGAEAGAAVTLAGSRGKRGDGKALRTHSVTVRTVPQ